MSVLSKVFAFTSYYKNMNSSTLSGSVDIIVVKDLNNNFKCSPFYVRFGKGYIMRVLDNTVAMYVNGKLCPINMRLSKSGDVYFEKEDLEEELDLFRSNMSLYRLSNLSLCGNHFKLKNNSANATCDTDSNNENNANSTNDDKSPTSTYSIKRGKSGCDVLGIKDDLFLLKMNYKRCLKDSCNEILKIRKLNLERRLLNLHKIIYFYYLMKKKHSTFNSFLLSGDNEKYIINNHNNFYRLLLGLILPEKSKVCNLTFGCKQSVVIFSKCLKERINQKDFSEVFESRRDRSLDNTQNLVVKLKGCSKCKGEFYLFYEFFTEIFFYLRNLVLSDNKSKKGKFLSYLEKRAKERYGNSFAGKDGKEVDHLQSFIPDHKQLLRMNLKEGKNILLFKIDGTNKQIQTNCFLWDYNSRIVISDIDGTITKSDALGHVYTMFGKDWTHLGIAELFDKIYANGYKILYLSSRPMGQMSYTKKYLKGIEQNGVKLPPGPVLLSPDSLFGAMYREMILRKPEVFKIACIETVKDCFPKNPFFSGFGNRITDSKTYLTVGVTPERIFTIDSKGCIVSSVNSEFSNSYASLTTMVDSIFPPYEVTSSSNAKIFNKWWKSYNFK